MLPILKGVLSFCNRLLVSFITSLIHPTFQFDISFLFLSVAPLLISFLSLNTCFFPLVCVIRFRSCVFFFTAFLSLFLHCLYFTFFPSVAFFNFILFSCLHYALPSFLVIYLFSLVQFSFLYPLYFRVSCSFGLLYVRAAGPYHHIYSAITGEPYKITPFSRVLLEKLICPHVVKK